MVVVVGDKHVDRAETKVVGCVVNEAISGSKRGCDAGGVSGITLQSSDPDVTCTVSAMLRFLQFAATGRPRVVASFPVVGHTRLSTLVASSFGFLRMASSVGVSGDMGMAVMVARVMPRSWSATAFRGLSGPDEGLWSLRRGVDAGRRARAVLSSGAGGGWSRLRFGDGYASCMGISPVEWGRGEPELHEDC